MNGTKALIITVGIYFSGCLRGLIESAPKPWSYYGVRVGLTAFVFILGPMAIMKWSEPHD